MTCTLNLITGILGAGKTSVLRHLLSGQHVEGRPAVVVGEFADTGLDGPILSACGATICQITSSGLGAEQKSYAAAVRQVLDQGDHPRIYLETSGVVEVSRVVDELTQDEELASRLRFGRTVTVLDAGAFSRHDTYFSEQLWAQVACADLLLINKTDRLGEEGLSAIAERVKARRPDVDVHFTYMGQVRRSAVMSMPESQDDLRILQGTQGSHRVAEFESFVFETQTVCIDRVRLGHLLLNIEGAQVAPFKGVLRCWDKTHCVNGFPGQLDWDSTPVSGPTKIAFIGLGLAAQREAIQACLERELEAQHEALRD